MEAKRRNLGSVRLTDAQYEEMDRLGFTSESAYVRHKMQQAETKLEVLKTTQDKNTVRQLSIPGISGVSNTNIEDQLTIQRLAIENKKLQEQLEQVTQSQQEALNGVHHKVHSMLQEELQKRDYEELKKSYAASESKLKKLQENLEEKKKENEALVKKLSFVELGKALLPGAITGLAKQYPKQMKGIAGTLGSLGMTDAKENGNTSEEENYLLQVIEHLGELFTEEQFEQVLQLMFQLAEQIKDDQGLLQKIAYYLNQLKRKTEAGKQNKSVVQ